MTTIECKIERCRERCFCRQCLHFVGTSNVGSPYIEVPTFPQSLHFVGKCLHFVGSAYESTYESPYIPGQSAYILLVN